ncbi:sigma factor-like helix-turn-helix DNA-binding protein [Sphingomonas sp. RT2P30]
MENSRPSRRMLKRLRRALDTMPAGPRAVFDLHRFEDRDYAQIADQLGIGMDEVERAIADAMLHLHREAGSPDAVERLWAWLRALFGRFCRR